MQRSDIRTQSTKLLLIRPVCRSQITNCSKGQLLEIWNVNGLCFKLFQGRLSLEKTFQMVSKVAWLMCP